MFLESGVIVFMGLMFIGIKFPAWRTLRWLAYPLAIDIIVSIAALIIHMGTFSGVMAAAVAGLLTSAFTTGCRWAFGWVEKEIYHPGALIHVKESVWRKPAKI